MSVKVRLVDPFPRDTVSKVRQHATPDAPTSPNILVLEIIVTTMSTDSSTPDVPLTAIRKYAHLYMPIITATLVFTIGPILICFAGPSRNNPMVTILLVAASAIPTYYIASNIYPANRPHPTLEESARFSRNHAAYRALILATYGRIHGTPFNLQFLIADFICSYIIGFAIGERPVGTEQRRSAFFNALLWLVGSSVLQQLVPPTMPTLAFWALVVDRTVWRTAYVALVDDVIGLLAHPDVSTPRGKLTLVLVQSFTITSLVYFALSWVQRWISRQNQSAEPT
jgi:hypothetical protein